MGDEHHDDDYAVETTDSGASKTFPKQCSALRKDDYVVIDGRPCKVQVLEVRVIALDIFTGKKYEDICPSTHNMEVPIVKRKDYQLMDIGDDGFCVIKDLDTRDQRNDVKIPVGSLGAEIREAFEKDETGILVSVVAAMDDEMILSWKNMPPHPEPEPEPTPTPKAKARKHSCGVCLHNIDCAEHGHVTLNNHVKSQHGLSFGIKEEKEEAMKWTLMCGLGQCEAAGGPRGRRSIVVKGRPLDNVFKVNGAWKLASAMGEEERKRAEEELVATNRARFEAGTAARNYPLKARKARPSRAKVTMYGEILEAMEHLCGYLKTTEGRPRLPKIKIGLLAEYLANSLLARYRERRWDITNRDLDKEYRQLRLKEEGHWGMEMLQKAAVDVGVDPVEVLDYLPHGLCLHINPGEVSISLGPNAPRQRIGDGASKRLGMSGGPLAMGGGGGGDTNFAFKAVGGSDSSAPILKLTDRHDEEKQTASEEEEEEQPWMGEFREMAAGLREWRRRRLEDGGADPAEPSTAPVSHNSAHLQAIREGITLKKVVRGQEKEKEALDKGNDVAAILRKRMEAVYGTDSNRRSDSDGDDWDE